MSTAAVSATEKSRLARQRRLESSRFPSARTLQRQSRNRSNPPAAKSVSTEQVGKSLLNASSISYDREEEEVAAANGVNNTITVAPSKKLDNRTPTPHNVIHGRSNSFSSFSQLNTNTNQEATSTSPVPVTPKRPDAVAAVTPDSGVSVHSCDVTPPVISSSLGFFLDSRAARGTPKRASLNRSYSTRSMPVKLIMQDSVPMDEALSKSNSAGVSSQKLPPSTAVMRPSIPLLTNSASHDSQDSSTALVVIPSNASYKSNVDVTRMTEALQLQTRPVHMTRDEQRLWNVVQDLLSKNETSAEGNALVPSHQDADSPTYWEQKCRIAEAQTKKQQIESDRAVRAMQRVMADVASEKEQALQALRDELKSTQENRDNTILKLTQKLKELQTQINTFKELQQDSDETVTSTSSFGPASADTRPQEVLALREENGQKDQEIAELKKQLASTRSGMGQDDVKKQLEEKSKSLENAKMIITSLENANGELARELRAKLKEKEEELSTLTRTSVDRKRTLDSLATELRDLQRKQAKPRLSSKQLASQKSLCQLLENNVKALRQAAVQHEARNDQQSVDKISHIISETFSSLKQNLELWEAYLQDVEIPELEDDPHMESALAKKHDETKALRKELEEVRTNADQEKEQLRLELQAVKDQLNANTELLEQKGRELTVLRASLNLDDYGNGYISDDGTDASFEEGDMKPATTSEDQTNAFTDTLLVNGGAGYQCANPNAAEMSDATAAEIEMLKNEIIQQKKEREATAAELQAERESLANAKMIISSLEKANKSMLEDLRSRLQDSNTAIASLLEKSMEHEKTIDGLKQELEKAHTEQEEEKRKSQKEVAQLREENLIFSMRLATKDREAEDLRDILSQYEGQEVSLNKTKLISSAEEKKEDEPASSDEDEYVSR